MKVNRKMIFVLLVLVPILLMTNRVCFGWDSINPYAYSDALLSIPANVSTNHQLFVWQAVTANQSTYSDLQNSDYMSYLYKGCER